MALEDNCIFAHFWDALTADFPSALSPTDAGDNGDPTVSGSKAVFESTGTGEGQIFTNTNTFNPGLDGDWAIAVRFKMTTDKYNSNLLIGFNEDSAWERNLIVRQGGDDSVICTYEYNGGNHYIQTGASDINFTTTYVVVVNFDSSDSPNYCKIYLDGTDKTAIRVGDFKAPVDSETMTLTSSTKITLGSQFDATRALDGEIEFVVVWDRALTTSEITTQMDEATLKAAILSGGGGGTNTTIIVPTGPALS